MAASDQQQGKVKPLWLAADFGGSLLGREGQVRRSNETVGILPKSSKTCFLLSVIKLLEELLKSSGSTSGLIGLGSAGFDPVRGRRQGMDCPLHAGGPRRPAIQGIIIEDQVA